MMAGIEISDLGIVILYSLSLFSLVILFLLGKRYIKYKKKYNFYPIYLVFIVLNIFVLIDNFAFGLIYAGKYDFPLLEYYGTELVIMLIAKLGLFVANVYMVYYIISGRINYKRKSSSQTAKSNFKHNRKIYVVDSDKNYRDRVIEILGADGYLVKSFIRGKDTIHGLKSNIPDVIIVDLILNDMNGRELIELIRSDDRFKQIKIIVLTFVTPSYDERRVLEQLNLDAYIKKPFDAPELIDQVEKLLH